MELKTLNDLKDFKALNFEQIVDVCRLDISDKQLGELVKKKVAFYKLYTKNGTEIPNEPKERVDLALKILQNIQ